MDLPLTKRKLPKLKACMSKKSIENLQNKELFNLEKFDAQALRRRKRPLHKCIILELQETGFTDSSDYLRDLIEDNIQLLEFDDIGIVVDLRKKHDYLEHITASLKRVEKYRDADDKKNESMELLKLALYFAEREKGIIWLAEKFFLCAIAVSSDYLLDGGQQYNRCNCLYAKFLLDKFPGVDLEQPFAILTEVRDRTIGKDWLLFEASEDGDKDLPTETIFSTAAMALHGVLLNKAKLCRNTDTAKSETLARLAERRARDANDTLKTAEAIVEMGISQLMMNNLNNAEKSFGRALSTYTEHNHVEGMCKALMHMAAVKQRLGYFDEAASLLMEMGSSAMNHGLRKQLGRALHLLGELQLKRERPDLGTQYLYEAFQCLLGAAFQKPAESLEPCQKETEVYDLYSSSAAEAFAEDAEQSRLMMAVSAGQEHMASYFKLIQEANDCTIAKVLVIEWKLSHAGWWNEREHHQDIPCACPKHQRSPLDVLKAKKGKEGGAEESEAVVLGRTDTTNDVTKLISSRRVLYEQKIEKP
ncbi:uncharacterized protein LOC121728539 isoform X2 [Aricia agestis]|uniref:uncharacterized protein LOC121728539 isoform X2 n=1 Tax=Aricia agestis TaxID=91739 RepID=UPI001C207AB9|nr:uncharacterized protein LOC121728539 isoform X2 [Aricia agestis]